MQSTILKWVVCASLATVALGQRPLPRFGQGRQLVNQGFGRQVNQVFDNQLNQAFDDQQIIQPQPQINIARQQQNRPVNTARQQQQVFVNQQTDIVEDVRDGPFWDGSYYFRYQSADGTVREEGGRPLGDGTIQVTGSYGYRAPNGEIIEMEYIADANGYRAFQKGTRADFVPPQRALPPQGLPPFQQNFIGGNNVVAAPQGRPVVRPRPTQQTLNQVRQPVNNNQVINPVPAPVPTGTNNFLRPGNQFNTNIRPTPASFQGFGQRNNQDIINFNGASSGDNFVALESPINNINA